LFPFLALILPFFIYIFLFLLSYFLFPLYLYSSLLPEEHNCDKAPEPTGDTVNHQHGTRVAAAQLISSPTFIRMKMDDIRLGHIACMSDMHTTFHSGNLLGS
jgi:hypothetical protein